VPEGTVTSALFGALRGLDALLARAVAAVRATGTPSLDRDPFRGLYVADAELDHLLARAPGGLTLGNGDQRDAPLVDLREAPRWAALASRCGLGRLELDGLLLALAPEIDMRYERLFAFLQDDVTRKRPTVDLALGLTCSSSERRIAGLEQFVPSSPLLRERLLELTSETTGTPAPLLSRQLRLDDRMVSYLLGHDSAEPRLGAAVGVVLPTAGSFEESVPEDVRRRLTSLAGRLAAGDVPGLVHCVARDGAIREAAAAYLAAGMDRRLMVVQFPRFAALDVGLPEAVALLRREVILTPAFVLWEGLSGLPGEGDDGRAADRLFDLIGLSGIAGALGSATMDDLPRAAQTLVGLTVELPVASQDLRARFWRRHLDAQALTLAPADVARLAASFQLGSPEIERAVRTARQLALWRDPVSAGVRPAELQQGARSQAGSALRHAARRMEPRHGWDDLVLPPDQLGQLHELSHRLLHRHTVFERWGFDRRLSLGAGVHALFAGPSGTGKTLAAEIVAGDLGLPLYRIDVSRIVSKYIGETEKNLHRIFAEAAASGPILFFDEADALFGKRTEVKDAHDRYANIEVSYLLQAMEDYSGLTILATNMKQNMDEAIVRRLAFSVTFPLPEEEARLRLWRSAWPPQTPVDSAIDAGFLARQFRVTGGNIRNIALAAAFAAAADGGVVTMAHVVRATRREFQKIGKTCVESEFGPYFPLLEAGTRGSAVA
jgi:hypothetical protein